MADVIYLDNAATTFPKPEEVYLAMDEMSRKGAVNAGRGGYKLAREASKIIMETKDALRKLIGVERDIPVIFCPSITIALNQIINGLLFKENSFIYYSPYEHNAVARTLQLLAKRKKVNLRELPIDAATGEILVENLPYIFSKEEPAAVFCTHISNVTGYILPINEIFLASKKYGSVNVLDTAQSLGLVKVDAKIDQNIDILAFAGHKSLYGPLGIGGFINIKRIPLCEYVVGGTGSDSLNLDMPSGAESKYEYASSNIVAIAGLKAALENLDIEKIYEHEKEITQYLTEKLAKIEGVKLFVPENRERHIGIVSFAVDGYKADDIGMILDEDLGIAVRTGYHCAPFIHVHLKDERYLGTVRVGVSQFTTKDEIDVLVNALVDL